MHLQVNGLCNGSLLYQLLVVSMDLGTSGKFDIMSRMSYVQFLSYLYNFFFFKVPFLRLISWDFSEVGI